MSGEAFRVLEACRMHLHVFSREKQRDIYIIFVYQNIENYFISLFYFMLL